MIRNVLEGKFDESCVGLKQLYDLGYSPTDIITTLFRVIKYYDMAEYLKLEFMKVFVSYLSKHFSFPHWQFYHSVFPLVMVYRKLDLHI